MRVLVACEFSGRVRDAFARGGHDAMSADLLPSEAPGPHYQGDVRDLLGDGWDLMIAFPPCTYLSRAGAMWWHLPGRSELTEQAVRFVRELYDAPIPRVAIENPVGRLNQLWRYPDQIVEPWMFGEPYRKKTCLWLKALPPLLVTVISTGRECWVNGGSFKRVSRLPRGGVANTPRDRSRTFTGLAAAMAHQWAA